MQAIRLWRHFCDDSLFRNSVYLMLATGVMAGFGFFFWLINARLFSAENIGLATTLISVMNLIAMLGLIGFDTAFVRYLPTSTQRNQKMNTGLILVSIASIVLSIGFLACVDIISPKLSFIKESPIYGLVFVVSCVMNSLNSLTDSIFLAGRKTKFSLIINTIFSVFKTVIPFAFVGFGPMGIFISAALAQTLGTLLSVAVMFWKFDYRPILSINKGVLKTVWPYSTANYAAGIFNLLPPAILPILITNHLNPTAAGYYYIVMMIGNLLYAIPWSTTKSLLAEGSYEERSLSESIRKSILVTILLLIPAITLLLIGGDQILQIFGKNFSRGGADFLYLVTLTAIPVTINSIYGSIFRIKKDLLAIVITNIFYTITILGFSYYLLSFGLIGIGAAWLIGNILTAFLNLTVFKFRGH